METDNVNHEKSSAGNPDLRTIAQLQAEIEAEVEVGAEEQ
jgi:hypothetical protein